MEKEQKIAEQQRKAQEMAFYGRLRNYYSVFALFWLTLIRFAFKHLFAFRPCACAFMFPVGSLTLVNLPVTAFAAFVTQTAVNIKIFELPDEVYRTDDVIFNAAFVAAITLVAYLVNDDANPLKQLAAMSVCYVAMLNMWPTKYSPVTFGDTMYSNAGLFFIEIIATVIIIFSTGPFKVWLDVKRGATSIREIADGYEDQRTWMHKTAGVDEGILPQKAQPERQNLKKRDPKAQDE